VQCTVAWHQYLEEALLNGPYSVFVAGNYAYVASHAKSRPAR